MANNSITGQDYKLKWTDFIAPPPVNRGSSVAFTSAAFSVNFQVRTGEEALGLPRPRKGTDLGFGVDNLKIVVSPNRARMWSVASSRTPAMLTHEQGHYNIVALVMWELYDDLLSPPQTFTTADAAQKWANSKLADAQTLINKLQSSPTRDGLYDTQTNHSQNTAGQNRWDLAFALAFPPTGMRFSLALDAEGIVVP